MGRPERAGLSFQQEEVSLISLAAEAVRRLDFRSDPADEIIAATSLAHDVPLLTRDTRMLASKVVPLALK